MVGMNTSLIDNNNINNNSLNIMHQSPQHQMMLNNNNNSFSKSNSFVSSTSSSNSSISSNSSSNNNNNNKDYSGNTSLSSSSVGGEINIGMLSSSAPISTSSSQSLSKAQLAIAEAHALKMLEEEKRKRDEKKRKRENEEQWTKLLRQKLDDEKKKLDQDESVTYSTNQELYSIFNELQMISHEYNISFDVPELVVVGMQSDGKSSFIESLLGFQFNIVESNIGTRRPLIISMQNNPEKLVPSCRFKKEHSSSISSSSSSSSATTLEEKWEEYETPVEDLTEEITRRTNDLTGTRGDRVSSQPIFLKVEFANCSNLNIYDTPGFRQGDEKLKYDILDMVKKLIEPKHRIIVCLEQSNVEWANSISRPLVAKFDPEFTRTILVNTKFDNRVKEFSANGTKGRESAHKYLEGEGIVANKKPFFISLPLKRNLSTGRYREAMKECYLEDYRKLLEINFDENRFGNQIGIFKVKSHIEKLLNEKYHQNLLPTLMSLENICKQTDKEIEIVQKELDDNNLQTLKQKALQYVQSFNSIIENLLEGSVVGNPDELGQTLTEELSNCCVAGWGSNFNSFGFEIQNANYSLYGGAQYERLLNELEFVIHSREFPETSINEVASAVGISKSNNNPNYELAATNIFRIKSQKVLLPIIDIALQRCSYIMRRLFDISISILNSDDCSGNVSSSSTGFNGNKTISLYEQFLDELKSKYFQFIDNIHEDCKSRLKDDFETFTKIVDFNLLNGLTEIKHYNYLAVSPEETKQRVISIMENNTNDNNLDIVSKSRKIDEATYTKVCLVAGKLFSGMRFFLSKFVRNKLNAFFLDPLFTKLGSNVIDHFSKLSDIRYQEIFQLGFEELKCRLVKLKAKSIDCKQNRDKMKSTLLKINNLNSNSNNNNNNNTHNTQH